MSESALPATCPKCGNLAQRAVLTPVGAALMDPGKRRAHTTNERSRSVPQLASQRHGAGCSCCRSANAPPASEARATVPTKSFPLARPWMISH